MAEGLGAQVRRGFRALALVVAVSRGGSVCGIWKVRGADRRGAPREFPGAPPGAQDSKAESMYSSTLSPVTTGA